jgi:hypothetical protein
LPVGKTEKINRAEASRFIFISGNFLPVGKTEKINRAEASRFIFSN